MSKELNFINQVEVIDKILRQLHKIDSKMLSGQFIPAYRDLRSLMSFFEQHKRNVIAEQTNQEIKPIRMLDNFDGDENA